MISKLKLKSGVYFRNITSFSLSARKYLVSETFLIYFFIFLPLLDLWRSALYSLVHYLKKNMSLFFTVLYILSLVVAIKHITAIFVYAMTFLIGTVSGTVKVAPHLTVSTSPVCYFSLFGSWGKQGDMDKILLSLLTQIKQRR